MKKICLARASGGIGDILMMTPGIKALAKEDWEVYVAINRHGTRDDSYYLLLKDNPYIKEIYDYRYVNKKRFDKFVDLSNVAYLYEQAGYPYTRCEIFARKIGVKIESNKPELFLETTYKNKIPTIALHFISLEKRRSLPEITREKLIHYLLNNTKYNLLLLDNKESEIISERIVSCHKKNVEESTFELSKCIYFIGVDSGWIHVAGALGIRSLGLFGSVNPALRIKDYNATSIWPEIECRGCFYKACNKTYQCMKLITLETILNSLKNENILL